VADFAAGAFSGCSSPDAFLLLLGVVAATVAIYSIYFAAVAAAAAVAAVCATVAVAASFCYLMPCASLAVDKVNNLKQIIAKF
jgi:hypothetical protein